MANNRSKASRSRNMSAVRSRNTKPELFVRSQLQSAGFRFKLHRADLAGRPDVVLPRFPTAVFIHGCFWHGHECKRGKLPSTNVEFWRAKVGKNRERDRAAKEILNSQGWRVAEIWECQLGTGTEQLIASLSTENGPNRIDQLAPGTK